ncbi:FtsX-like permease family protein [Actinoplanes sp. NBC_00393]|uniref:ABC transporter permease n=1 Tax=Actinoplanes sp. NBC_00393 TaxID=2975953 RepID=UPI002E1E9ECB
MMLRLSRAGMAERWTLFVGAALSVCLGVALVQSSLLLLITAATMDTPPGLSATEELRFDDGRTAAVSMLGVVMGGAAFLAIFIISSTFAFTVDQRRRDLALLRLVGGSRGQLRRLLLGEAVLLGTLGAGLGIPAGLGVMAVHAWLMRRMGFVPDGFHGEWRTWIIGASIGTGLLLAVAGAMTAAHRAARVRPLDALRDSGEAARVMTAGRWIFGLLFLGGALALTIVAPHGGPDGGAAMAMNVPLCAAVAAAAFGPLLVPAVARLIPTGMGGPLSSLARANLRDGRRRSAAVAAPVTVLVALVVGQTGASASFTASGVDQMRRSTAADLVVSSPGQATPARSDASAGPPQSAGPTSSPRSDGLAGPEASPSSDASSAPVGARIAAMPGVAAVSTEIELPGRATTGDAEDRETDTVTVLVVDFSAYARMHPGSEALLGLSHRTAATGPGGDLSAGTARLELPGLDLGEIPVAAGVPAAVSGGADLLLPPGMLPPAQLASAPTATFVRLKPGATPPDLSAYGSVATVDEWLAADAENRNSTSSKIMIVVLGLGALYALVGVINSVVIGAAARRREFAEARVTGLSRGQVIRTALAESAAVTLAGILLGLVAAGTAFIAALTTTEAVTGTATLDPPWLLLLAITALVLLATGVTSALTSWSATRERPVALLGARE